MSTALRIVPAIPDPEREPSEWMAAYVARRFAITALPDGRFHVADRYAKRGSDRMGAHVPDGPAAVAWCVRSIEISSGRI